MYEKAQPVKSVDDIRDLAERAHAGQTDKIGVPYFEHVRAVADGLAPFGDDLIMAGLLHDIIEDTDWTSERLFAAGVPARVVAIVEAVTKEDGVLYEDMIWRITGDPQATLVKIADNAHNSRPDRTAQMPAARREHFATKYGAARALLWSAANREDVETIVRTVNPALLTEFGEWAARTPVGVVNSPATNSPR